MTFRNLIFIMLCLTSGCASQDFSATSADTEILSSAIGRRTAKAAAIDDRISVQARNELNNDPLIPFQSKTTLLVYNGSLLVAGETLDESIHLQIIEKLRIISGVKQVQDEITITPPITDANALDIDNLITNNILTELDKQALPNGFSSRDIAVLTEDNGVYLMGLVYPDEADLVTNIAQKIPGVTKVVKLFEYLR